MSFESEKKSSTEKQKHVPYSPHFGHVWCPGDAQITVVAPMSALFDGFDACAYQKGADEIFQDAWDVRNRVGKETQLNFVLRPASPDLESKSQLLDSIEKIKTLNPAGISFYNYGFLPQQNLEWTRDAFEML